MGFIKNSFFLTTALSLSGCVFAPQLNDPAPPPASAATPVSYLPGGQEKKDQSITDGLKSMRFQDFERASGYFNQAVSADPNSSDAHFLNGFAYHMRALSGDAEMYEYAEVGYKMAAKINTGNRLALLQLGRMYMQLHRYRDAQDQFARGLLVDADNPEMLVGLAMASYLAQDIQTTYAALERALDTIPSDPTVLRLQCLVHAAMGRSEIAQKHFENLRKVVTDEKIITYIASRLQDWRKFYRYNGIGVVRDALHTHREEVELESKKPSELADQATGASQRMTYVEVTFIRAQTTEKESSGANLIKNLNFFAGSNNTISGNNIVGSPIKLKDRLEGFKSILKNNVSLQQLQYTLNVGTTESSRFDILARPTLIAIDRNTASYNSGSTLNISTAGAQGGSGQTTTQQVGITLAVTPFFYSDTRLKLNINVTNSSFQPVDSEVQGLSTNNAASTAFQLASDTLSTNVIMDMGKTLILSGLNTRNSTVSNNGVSRMKNIPVLGHLFGDRTSLLTNQSTIILITPHPQDVANSDRSGQVHDALYLTQQVRQRRLDELRVRYDSQFALPTDVNMEIVNGLMLNQFNREFRPADVLTQTQPTKEEVDFVMGRMETQGES